ncbi:MAG: LPS export ABC transporter periplasmic protein LptC [Chromatiales bacterium]|nr:LPS export ABC transporter periplasmic protein LptC [Chromatiales bacterium]
MSLVKDTRSTVRVVLLALAAGASGFVMLQNNDPEQEENYSPPSLGLAYFIKGAEMSGTGKDGKILYRLRADRAEQSTDNDHIDLTNIALTYEPSADVPWDVFADKGKIPQDGKLVELSGNVLILSKDPGKSETSIRTTQINLFPDEKLARTNKKVGIMRDGQQVKGTGMEAHLDTSEVKILSNVNGKFVP